MIKIYDNDLRFANDLFSDYLVFPFSFIFFMVGLDIHNTITTIKGINELVFYALVSYDLFPTQLCCFIGKQGII